MRGHSGVHMKRYTGIAIGAFVMAAHAYAIGGLMDSPFFLVSLPWMMVAIWALRGDLTAIPSMAWVMTAILVLSLAVSVATTTQSQGAISMYCLSLVPSIISWQCLSLYINHLRGEERARTSIDAQNEYHAANLYWDQMSEELGVASGLVRRDDTLAARINQNVKAASYVAGMNVEESDVHAPTYGGLLSQQKAA